MVYSSVCITNHKTSVSLVFCLTCSSYMASSHRFTPFESKPQDQQMAFLPAFFRFTLKGENVMQGICLEWTVQHLSTGRS